MTEWHKVRSIGRELARERIDDILMRCEQLKAFCFTGEHDDLIVYGLAPAVFTLHKSNGLCH